MNLSNELSNSDRGNALKHHPLLKAMRAISLSRDDIVTILSQWYYPLHYFPVFLSRYIAIAPTIEAKTFISKILWQELGEGVPDRAHETVYISTMKSVGFNVSEFVGTPKLAATSALVAAYAQASHEDHLRSLGYLFATECADLAMVGSIGASVRKLTKAERLPWVDIHVQQEPDHTESVSDVLESGFSAEDRQTVRNAATEMFALWCNFFSGISHSIGNTTAAQTAE
jgi:pyrroloquinoline quinone (PQQ) biosynthesis protein C